MKRRKRRFYPLFMDSTRKALSLMSSCASGAIVVRFFRLKIKPIFMTICFPRNYSDKFERLLKLTRKNSGVINFFTVYFALHPTETLMVSVGED